jgi:hypothetical protein
MSRCDVTLACGALQAFTPEGHVLLVGLANPVGLEPYVQV